jgi:hypothetical protein
VLIPLTFFVVIRKPHQVDPFVEYYIIGIIGEHNTDSQQVNAINWYYVPRIPRAAPDYSLQDNRELSLFFSTLPSISSSGQAAGAAKE